MKLRSSIGDRTFTALAAAAVCAVAVGGQLGAGCALVVFASIQFPGLLGGLSKTSKRTDSRPAMAGLLAAAAGIAVVGITHLQTVIILGLCAAAVVWLWPWLTRGGRAGHTRMVQHRTGGRIKGNHHGRLDAIEEVPSGRIGVARKRGGDGPTQIEMCARSDRAGQLAKTAGRRHVHARWAIASRPEPCPLNDRKRHWRLRAAGPQDRSR